MYLLREWVGGVEVGTEPDVEVANIVVGYDFGRRFRLEEIARFFLPLFFRLKGPE